MIAHTPTHNKTGGFAKGNKLAAKQSSRGNATAKQLKQLCIDVLSEQGIGGRPLIENVIRTVSRDKPEALLPFAGKLIPTESEVVTTKFSPIVLEAKPQLIEHDAVVVEQTLVETNVELAPVELIEDIRPLIDTHAIVNDKVVKVMGICTLTDEEL